jgi:hypothetical protein
MTEMPPTSQPSLGGLGRRCDGARGRGAGGRGDACVPVIAVARRPRWLPASNTAAVPVREVAVPARAVALHAREVMSA